MTVPADRVATDTGHKRYPAEVLLQGAKGSCGCAHLRLAVRQLALQAEVQGPEAAGEAGPQWRDGARGRRVPRPQRQLLQPSRTLRNPLASLRPPSSKMVPRPSAQTAKGWRLLGMLQHTAAAGVDTVLCWHSTCAQRRRRPALAAACASASMVIDRHSCPGPWHAAAHGLHTSGSTRRLQHHHKATAYTSAAAKYLAARAEAALCQPQVHVRCGRGAISDVLLLRSRTTRCDARCRRWQPCPLVY